MFRTNNFVINRLFLYVQYTLFPMHLWGVYPLTQYNSTSIVLAARHTIDAREILHAACTEITS